LMNKKMKKVVLFLLVCVGVFAMAACGKETNGAPNPYATEPPRITEAAEPSLTDVPTATVAPSATPEPTATSTPIPSPTSTPTPEVDWYQAMLDRSVMSTGNNARLKKVIEKARSGEIVNIATLGGSITEGANATPWTLGYAYRFAEKFAAEYGVNGGENINYVNAGIGGTPSALGVMRFERDVLAALGAEPDLFVIEFEVNDYAEATNGRAYESLVYQVLSQTNDAAVIMVFAVRDDMWNVQGEHYPIALRYEIPVVAIKNAVEPAIKMGQLDKTVFFSDAYHPTNYGHDIMSDCIMQLVKVIDAEEADERKTLPENAIKGRDFVGTKMIDSTTEGIVFELGAFTKVDSEIQRFSPKMIPSFPNNWMHDSEGGNDSFKMTLTCKNLLMNYKTGSAKFGTAEVYVDGNLVKSLNGSGGWNGCNVVLLIDEKEAAEHVVEIRMAEGQEDKAFTIYAFGYTQ